MFNKKDSEPKASSPAPAAPAEIEAIDSDLLAQSSPEQSISSSTSSDEILDSSPDHSDTLSSGSADTP